MNSTLNEEMRYLAVLVVFRLFQLKNEKEIARFGPLHMLVGSRKVLFIAESKARVSWFFL